MQILLEILAANGPDARIRVDTKYGHISYGAQDWEKALEYFSQEGTSLRVQRNIFDEGQILAWCPNRNDNQHGYN